MKITAIIFLIIGITSTIIQNTFYGYVDENGILQDSIFLPLGAFATLIGSVLLLVVFAKYFIKKIKK